MATPNNYNPESPAVMITSNLGGGMLFFDTNGLIEHLREIANELESHKETMGFMNLTVTPNGFEVRGVQETVAEINMRRPSEVQ